MPITIRRVCEDIHRARREGCVFTDDEIRQLCGDHKNAFLLWDGAFSLARTVNPTAADYALYKRFIDGAVYYHIKIGCSSPQRST